MHARPRHRERALLADRQAGVIVAGEAVSVLGDQLARVAVAILIFGRTHSPLLAAASIAASYLPWVFVAPLLAGLGDRYSRRRVLVSSDAYRCVVTACLAIPGLPSWGIIALIFLLTCGDPPFTSARSAMLPDVFGPKRYIAGQSLMLTASNAADVVGYAVGGLVVAGVGTRPALLIDAATFGLSSLALRLALDAHLPPPADPEATDHGRGWALVWRTPVARWSLCLGLAMLCVGSAPLGIIVPWALQLSQGSVVVGLIAAAAAAGSVLGTGSLPRMSAALRARVLIPGTIFGCALQIGFFGVHTVVPTLILLGIARVFVAFQTVANQLFVLAIPPEARSRAFGVAGTVLYLGQGLSILGAGALVNVVLPSTVVAITGVAGVVALGALALTRPREVTHSSDRVTSG